MAWLMSSVNVSLTDEAPAVHPWHVMMGIGAPPVSQKLKQAVDTAMKPIVDKVYRRGMHMLKINTYLQDNLAEKLLEQEKVGGDELMKLINDVAKQGKL